MITGPLTHRCVFLAALLASALSLAAAFVAQYGFKLHPCELCLFQRIPYALAIGLGLLGLLLWAQPRARGALYGLLVLSFLAGSGLGFYHAMVEKKWIAGPTACTSEDAGGRLLTLEEIRNRINAAPVVACDQPAWEYKGVTMAGLNGAWSLLLALTVAGGALKASRRN